MQYKGTRLLSTAEVAERLAIPSGTLRYWRSAGIGPAYVKLGGSIRYDERDVQSYVDQNRRIPSVRA